MGDLFNELEKVDKQTQPGRRKRKSKAEQLSHVNPLARQQVKREEATAATMKLTGQYWQRTVKIPPEWRELIREVARIGKFRSIADAERWIISEGLKAFFERGSRPHFEETIEREALLYAGPRDNRY
ncbi:MAG: hypothetical protein ACE5FD_00430 [Anaerolineae bacterium]